MIFNLWRPRKKSESQMGFEPTTLRLVLQTLGKLAIRLQALDRKVNVPETFGHFRSDQAHAQGGGPEF